MTSSSVAQESDKYTREHLAEIIDRLRENPTELDRISSSLTTKHLRTLRRDMAVGGWEGRAPGRRVDPSYMQAVCRTFLNRFGSSVYDSIVDIVVGDTNSQSSLDAMIGEYKAYWPSGEAGNFTSWPMEIQLKDNKYSVSSLTGDGEYKYDHFGYAFLIHNRIHVIDVRRNGIRKMLFHFEPFPARNYIKGLIVNVLRSDEGAQEPERLFAVHFLAVHQRHPRFKAELANQEIASALHHPRNRAGVIRV
jgi:hypothetical protein